jgi:hypothetical protein
MTGLIEATGRDFQLKSLTPLQYDSIEVISKT